ncbi:MAG: ATP-dependent DNA helicase RecG [Saccharospirillaceae bacterium]|nr:ATP-dependent DNA helicase RecG [Pseudomonadales bacterium]NRB79574.1 ATP-dependent DNA helicase RecG [Saccharospirillaceae bacterium]
MSVKSDLISLKGVGGKLLEKLHKIDVFSKQDLLFHLPYKYQDRTQIIPLKLLKANMAGVVQGRVTSSHVMFGKKRSLLVRLSDENGSVGLRFYFFTKGQQGQFKEGNIIRCYGEIRPGQSGFEIYHPEYQVLKLLNTPLDNTLTPLYPTTDGLTQNKVRLLVEQVIADRESIIAELLPASLLEQYKLPTLVDALNVIHHPQRQDDIQQLLVGNHPAQKRLAIEELLAHHLSLKKHRAILKQQHSIAFKDLGVFKQKLIDTLPFDLTNAQNKVIQEIADDLSVASPMLRLVQGDVGSGKTLVATLSALQVIEHGFQVAMMAPTEILAEQHYDNFTAWLEPLGIKVAWLVGKQTKKQREEALALVASGEAKMVVGTHALFQDAVEFYNLALAIIDEQHRFGVDQRLALKEKGKHGHVHQLTMTATPIPRTLAMSAYADLDCSVIDELPPGRTPIKTTLIAQPRRPQVVERVKVACDEGKQIYWVCTLIDENEEMELEAAQKTYENLTVQLSPHKVGLVHGKMKSKQKAQIMHEFKRGDIKVLVATTVIEVGVDVPNASVMIIENPERLGLSQLHQLRGRVGRGRQESFCILMYGEQVSQIGKERLQVMRETNDGFVIAQKDLEIRGPGEVLGTRQTGAMQFKIADLVRDQALLPQIEQLAAAIIRDYPQNMEALIKRWLSDSARFAQV